MARTLEELIAQVGPELDDVNAAREVVTAALRRVDGTVAELIEAIPLPGADQPDHQAIGVGMGGNIGDAAMAEKIAAAGLRHVRWALTATACWDEANRVWRIPPRIMAWSRALEAAGIVQTVCLTYTPRQFGRPGIGQFSMWTNLAEWENFVRLAVDNLPWCRRWEVWNEPNHGQLPNIVPGLIPLQDNGADRVMSYLALLAVASAAIPRRDVVLAGAMSPAPDKAPGAMAPLTFVREWYRQMPEVGRLFDRLSDHPYSGDRPIDVAEPWGHVATIIPACLAAMEAAGDPGKLVDATEVGWVTEPLHPPYKPVTEARQAELIGDAIRKWRAIPWAGVLFLFAWQDLGTAEKPGPAFGLTRRDGSAKPSLAVVKEALT